MGCTPRARSEARWATYSATKVSSLPSWPNSTSISGNASGRGSPAAAVICAAYTSSGTSGGTISPRPMSAQYSAQAATMAAPSRIGRPASRLDRMAGRVKVAIRFEPSVARRTSVSRMPGLLNRSMSVAM